MIFGHMLVHHDRKDQGLDVTLNFFFGKAQNFAFERIPYL
jgi:hypothetical protein